jgi:HK97 family phage major capsid protein
LLATSVPAFDVLLAELLGLGAAAHEDTAFFAASTVAGGPTALLSQAGISTINTGGSANGGNIAYSDILAVLAKAAAVKAAPPFVWFVSPRTFYSRIMGMLDLSSRPLYIPTLTQGLMEGPLVGSVQRPVGSLLGYPVFVTPYIPETQTLGSGSGQASIIFANPKYLHVAQDSALEIAVSLERFFDANQVAIRGTSHEDFAVAPAAGVIVLLGVN